MGNNIGINNYFPYICIVNVIINKEDKAMTYTIISILMVCILIILFIGYELKHAEQIDARVPFYHDERESHKSAASSMD